MSINLDLSEYFSEFIAKIPHLLTGALSSAVSRSAVAPFERIIILKQTSNPQYEGQGVFRILNNMIKGEGILSCFKGNATNLLRVAPFSGIEFYSFEIYKQVLKNLFKRENLTSHHFIFCGALSGMTAATILYPLDITRTILSYQIEQNSQYKGIIQTMRSITRQRGFLHLYSGLGTTMIGTAQFCGLKLGTFQTLKNIYSGENQKQLSNTQNLIIGGISGCFAVSVSYPTDLLRRRQQIQAIQHNKHVPLIEDVKLVWKTAGIKGFYKGLDATYIKILPAISLTFAINEFLKNKVKIH